MLSAASLSALGLASSSGRVQQGSGQAQCAVPTYNFPIVKWRGWSAVGSMRVALNGLPKSAAKQGP